MFQSNRNKSIKNLNRIKNNNKKKKKIINKKNKKIKSKNQKIKYITFQSNRNKSIKNLNQIKKKNDKKNSKKKTRNSLEMDDLVMNGAENWFWRLRIGIVDVTDVGRVVRRRIRVRPLPRNNLFDEEMRFCGAAADPN